MRKVAFMDKIFKLVYEWYKELVLLGKPLQLKYFLIERPLKEIQVVFLVFLYCYLSSFIGIKLLNHYLI